jgi:hypothetical protein
MSKLVRRIIAPALVGLALLGLPLAGAAVAPAAAAEAPAVARLATTYPVVTRTYGPWKTVEPAEAVAAFWQARGYSTQVRALYSPVVGVVFYVTVTNPPNLPPAPEWPAVRR